jgi:hypothetical protein
MQNFTLETQFEIIGIASASGLVYKDNSLFVISDNSSFLYEYQILEKQLSKIQLLENTQENIPKKDKFDFECITLKGGKLHILGSGSTSKREKKISYNVENSAVDEKDLSELYKKLKQTSSISDEELNIEGVLYHDGKWWFFQRGNGANSKNGIFILNDNLKYSGDIKFIPIQLPKIKHIETSFTDAVIVDDKIYFLATAEDTISTYDDGEILGSIFGQMNCETLEIDFTLQLSESKKFEGLTLFKKTDTEIQFLLCEDNDTEDLNTVIYKLGIKK